MVWFCSSCVRDPWLIKNFLSKPSQDRTCDNCGASYPGSDLGDLIGILNGVIFELYSPIEDSPSEEKFFELFPAEGKWKAKFYSCVVSELLGCSEKISEMISEEFNREQRANGLRPPYAFVEKGVCDEGVQEEWRGLLDRLKYRNRFFSSDLRRFLDGVFCDLNDLVDVTGDPVVIEAGPGKTIDKLWRARVFENESEIEGALRWPERHLGTPPKGVKSSGRLNPLGVSIFYGAGGPRTAMAEVRPPVGATVVTACFNLVRAVRLLDLRVLAKVGRDIPSGFSYFDPSVMERLRRREFLRKLALKISAPVLPSCSENNYFPTQVLADYLSASESLRVDGVIYSSSQVASENGESGWNVALFCPSSKVFDSDSIKETARLDVEYDDEEMFTDSYYRLEFHEGGSVREKRLRAEPETGSVFLELDRRSIRVSEVRYVEYKSDGNHIPVKVPQDGIPTWFLPYSLSN